MTAILAALFGFAPRGVQATIPPYAAMLGLVLAGYFGGAVISLTARMMALHWAVDAGIRGLGVIGALLTLHSAYRTLIHGDDYSWGGAIRRLFYR